MKQILSFFLIFAAVLGLPAAAHAENITPSVSAPSAVLVEKYTGEVLYEKNAHTRSLPASVTKIMTLLLLAEDIEAGKMRLDDTVTASRRAASFGGSCVFLAEGEKMSVAEMIKCIAVVSANDCAVAMAEHVSGNEEIFVRRMNERAAELGMSNTHFTNCTGLFDEKEHYTTAYDVALMSRELLRHEFIKDYTTIWMDTIRGGEFGLSSTNRLVYSYPDCTGLKTGYTSAAKYCISATAEREGTEYIAVVMHSESAESRNADAAALLDYAFANYSLCSLRDSAPLPSVPVGLGRAASVALDYSGPEYCLTPRTDAEPSCTLELTERVAAPVHKGDRLGTLMVYSGGKLVSSVPLVAAEDVERLGYFGILARLSGAMLGL